MTETVQDQGQVNGSSPQAAEPKQPENLVSPPEAAKVQAAEVTPSKEERVLREKKERPFVMRSFTANQDRTAYYLIHGKRVRLKKNQSYEYKLHEGQKEVEVKIISVVHG